MNTQSATTPNAPAPVLAREEVEALLTDYAFGDIGANDKARFEASLSAYPDLTEELHLIQESFGAVRENLEILDREQTQRLKNLTVHVQERIRYEAERRSNRFRLVKFFVPALAMCVMLAVISIPQAFNTSLLNFMGASPELSHNGVLTPDDIQRLEELQVDESIVNANGIFTDNTGTSPSGTDESDKEAAMVARKMLTKETMNAIAANRSAFQDYFDNSSVLLNSISDEDADGVTAAMTEM